MLRLGVNSVHPFTERGMPHCSHCGTQFDESCRYCKSCGLALTGTLVQRTPAWTVTSTPHAAVSVRPAAYASSSRKSVGGAVLLAALFGPLGMLYSSVPGALVMLFASIVLGALTDGLSVFITWPVCMIWAAIAAQSYNESRRGIPYLHK